MRILFLVLSILCFLLAALSVAVGPLSVGWLGLAFLALAMVPIKE